MDTNITSRVRVLMSDMGYDQTLLAERCNMNKFTLNRYVNGKAAWTDRALLKIAEALEVNFKWLRDGVGSMYRNEVEKGNTHYAALQEALDNECGTTSTNNDELKTERQAAITARVLSLIEEKHSQASFARKCDLHPQNFNRYVNGRMPWTDRALLKIADTLGLNFKWLRDGTGSMYREEKAAGNVHHATLQTSLGGGVANANIINGEHNSGTQTIHNAGGETELLKQKVAMLEKMLEDKDKVIDLLKKVIEQKNV